MVDMRTLSAPLVATCLAAASLLAADAAWARPTETEAAELAPEGGGSVVQQYCSNVRDAAADARFAWQMEALREVEKQVEERIAALDARQAEFEDWLRRREELALRAKETLVAVYANMRPDAAAEQLAILEDDEAAAVLTNLVPRTASAIMTEMQPERAARLAIAMAGPPEKQEESTR
jgi:flagellar motility protein MotE (MotC chaperone)